jgi:Rrf2 family protein
LSRGQTTGHQGDEAPGLQPAGDLRGLELARAPDRQLSVAEIGEKYSGSAHHLAKVMNILGRAGLVESVRGVGGGYRFVGNARRVTLLDIIELFEDVASPAGPSSPSRAIAPTPGAALLSVLTEIDDNIRATLGSITITTMLKLMERVEKPKQRRKAAAHSRA